MIQLASCDRLVWQSDDNTHSAGQGSIVMMERISIKAMLVPFWPIAAVQRSWKVFSSALESLDRVE